MSLTPLSQTPALRDVIDTAESSSVVSSKVVYLMFNYLLNDTAESKFELRMFEYLREIEAIQYANQEPRWVSLAREKIRGENLVTLSI